MDETTDTPLPHAKQPLAKIGFYHVLWIFVLCSVLGLVVETVVSYPIDGAWKDRAGLVWGPLSPIYGLGGVLVTVLLGRLAGARPLVLFAASALAGGAFEYAAGWFWESAFGIVAWSYADQPFNIGGHTCLGIALVWGFIGLAWVKLAQPRIVRLLDQVPERWRKWPTGIASAVLIVDIVVTLGAFGCWFQRQAHEPVETAVQEFYAANFDDEFMEQRFQTMSLYVDLAKRG